MVMVDPCIVFLVCVEPSGGPVSPNRSLNAGHSTRPLPSRLARLGPCVALGLLLMACAASPARTSAPTTAVAATAEWDRAVAQQLTADFDRNDSGTIDTPAELAAMPCELWRALDQAVQDDTATPLASTYGLRAGLLYRGDRLGVDRSLRAAARGQLELCQLRAVAEAPAEPIDVSKAIVALPESGGSSRWDRKVKTILLGTFDLDESGVLDSLREIDSIHCDTWRAMDAGARATDDTSMARFYGFADGYVWVGNNFGFDELHRRSALKAMLACGLQVR